MSIVTAAAGQVLRIEIARPQKKNAITGAMYGELAAALRAAGSDAAVRAVVLHGSREIFTAGNDLEDFLHAGSGPLEQRPAAAFMAALTSIEKPVVAAVNGAAVGIGTTMLLHCDLAYCADDAMFSMPFVSLGLCPEFASSLLLPIAAGAKRAAEKLMLGEPISPEEAVEMGLVNRILAAGEVQDYALRQAARLAALPPNAVRTTKRLLKTHWKAAVERAIAEEGAAFTELLGSAEAKEAFTAFLEKRKPDFSRSG
ncbi:MAG TPA: enoyl-CoA hydratase-related protein [Burkholderiaceae bacterium]|nr:enoyl-CoA hydratase-related protein [Burkholderiaceae bacterium]